MGHCERGVESRYKTDRHSDLGGGGSGGGRMGLHVGLDWVSSSSGGAAVGSPARDNEPVRPHILMSDFSRSPASVYLCNSSAVRGLKTAFDVGSPSAKKRVTERGAHARKKQGNENT